MADQVKEQTESERILNAFDTKLEILNNLSLQITQQVTNTVGFDLRKGSEAELKNALKEGSNFIGELDSRLSRLQRLIEAFGEIEYNLSRLL